MGIRKINKDMYTITITKEVTSDRNLCDHIWVEEVFLTKVGVFFKALFTRLDNEKYGFKWILTM